MIRFLAIAALIIGFVAGLRAQQLDPRAYSVSPTGVHFLIANYGYSTGDLNFDPSLPINGSAQIHNVTTGYVRSIGVAGRTANVSALLPYVLGNLQETTVENTRRSTVRINGYLRQILDKPVRGQSHEVKRICRLPQKPLSEPV